MKNVKVSDADCRVVANDTKRTPGIRAIARELLAARRALRAIYKLRAGLPWQADGEIGRLVEAVLLAHPRARRK